MKDITISMFLAELEKQTAKKFGLKQNQLIAQYDGKQITIKRVETNKGFLD